MMTERRRLANRRSSETFDIESQGLRFTATVSRFADGQRRGNFSAEPQGRFDGRYQRGRCVGRLPIALQYGVPLETIRRALMRDSQGRASGPLAVALDKLGGER